MPVGKKLAVVLSVLVTGGSAAIFFRKDASPTNSRQDASLDNPFRQRVERRVSGDAAVQVEPVLPAAATTAPPATSPAEAAPTFQKSLHPIGALLEPIEGVPGARDEEADDLRREAALAGDRPAGATTTHRIADGDTLSRLAQQYLGRADRYTEIFALNRDVLSSPDLLPIGATLKIPPLEHAAHRSADSTERSLAPPPARVRPLAEPRLPLVPVPGATPRGPI